MRLWANAETALVGKVRHQGVHPVAIGAAAQNPTLAGLVDQANKSQVLKVMRERRRRYVQMGLDFTDRQSIGRGPHQKAVYRQSGWVAQLGQTIGSGFKCHVHGVTLR